MNQTTGIGRLLIELQQTSQGPRYPRGVHTVRPIARQIHPGNGLDGSLPGCLGHHGLNLPQPQDRQCFGDAVNVSLQLEKGCVGRLQ